MKAIVTVLFCLGSVTQAADLMTCKLKGGGSILVSSKKESEEAVLSLDNKASEKFAAEGSQELTNTEVPFVAEWSYAKKTKNLTEFIEIAGAVDNPWKCGFIVFFKPTKRSFAQGSILPVNFKRDSRFYCGETFSKVVECKAGEDLESLTNLQNYARSEVED